MMPDPGVMLGPVLLDTPTAMVHVPGAMILLTLTDYPMGAIVRDYLLAMAILTIVAIAATWYVQDRTLRRALAPVSTVEGALRRLADGEYSRLTMVGHAEGEAGVVDAYNAAADELASSIRRRAEAEANLRQFVAEAGHELRTPLTVIMGFVDVLRQGAIAEQALAQRILESVAAEGERMRSLITNLLLLARLDAVAHDRNETVDVSSLVAEAVDAFRSFAGGSRITVSAQPDVLVTGSASELREVVSNLLDNALKYAPSANVRVSVEKDGKFAAITVHDDGPGMSAALRARAFDRFSRGDERGSVPGSGLGLAIVKRIATRAGGDVRLESAPGQGTQVRVLLPLVS
jgi:two-component system OmpR family sensor kinase